jgi:hypothetical protein
MCCRQLYRNGTLDDQMVDLDLDALGLNGQMGGGMSAQGNPLQAFAAMMEAMAGRAGGRVGARARQPGKGSMTVRVLQVGELAMTPCICNCDLNAMLCFHKFSMRSCRHRSLKLSSSTIKAAQE